jgi:hypothetical protein
MEGRQDLTLRRRLPPLRYDTGARAGTPSTSRPLPHHDRLAPPPYQGVMGANPNETPLGYRHRHSDR